MKKTILFLMLLGGIFIAQTQTLQTTFQTDFTETNVELIEEDATLDRVMEIVAERGLYLVYGKHVSFGAGINVPMTRISGTYKFTSTAIALDKNILYEYYFMIGTDGYFAEGMYDDLARLAAGFYRFIYTNYSANSMTLPSVTFNGNAPAGMKALRVKVDMTSSTPAANGVFVKVGTNITPCYDTNKETYDDDNKPIYEAILYVNNSNALTYTFFNGIDSTRNLISANTFTKTPAEDFEYEPVLYSTQSVYEAKKHEFYDKNYIQKIEVTFTESNWDAILQANKPLDIFLPATVKINGVQLDSVGVKYKGNSSYSAGRLKNPFNFSLDEFRKTNQYQDYTTVKVANVFGDPSFVREVISYEIINNYMEAPKANFVEIYINGEYFGLYTNTESVNRSFCKKYFNSKNKTFMSCSPALQPTVETKSNLRYLSANPEDYASAYELKSDEGWDVFINLSNVVTHQPQNLETKLDINRFLWLLAFSNVAVNIDSYLGVYSQNYYLYENVEGKFLAAPWDFNLSFGAFNNVGIEDRFLQLSVTARQQLALDIHKDDAYWPLIKAIHQNESWKKMYLAHCKTILNEYFNNNQYLTMATFWQQRIAESVAADKNKFFSLNAFNNSMESDYAFNGYAVNGIKTLMEARKIYLNARAEMTNPQPDLYDPTRTYQSGAKFMVKATNADKVYLMHRYKTIDHKAFTKAEMSLIGDRYEILLPITSGDLEYYYYAENSNIGCFLPARAAKEFYSVNVNPSMKIEDNEQDYGVVYYNSSTKSLTFNFENVIQEISIFSIDGKQIGFATPNSAQFSFSMHNIATQMILVKVVSKEGITNKKIIIR